MYRYLGRPWIKGEYDCWSLVRDVYSHELGISIPHVPVDASNMFAVRSQFRDSDIYGLFEKTDTPVNFDVATIVRPGSGHVMHCGVWHKGRILHNRHGFGVLYEPAQRMTIDGYYSYAKDSLLPRPV